MKPTKRLSMPSCSGSEVALCLQQELAAAIHGAFEVAVEIAVREVTELIGQATGDIYEEMRRENESLKQRLRRAEAGLEGGGGSPAAESSLPGFHLRCSRATTANKAGGGRVGAWGRGADQPPPDPEDGHVSRSDDGGAQLVRDAASDPEKEHDRGGADDALNKGATEDVSHERLVKMESVSQPCQNQAAQHHHSSPPPNDSTTEQVIIKQEKPEEGEDASACCLDPIKVEAFSLECLPAVQSAMLEEWNPGPQDVCFRDPNTQMPCAHLAEGHLSNLTAGLPPSTDLPSLSEFPNALQLAEASPTADAPPQLYGVRARTKLSHVASLYVCKACGQTFQLPSLLRRHYGLCQQKLQQHCQQPLVRSKRTRLQLYPPGCSPFRCSECNREFNRMENLKTHLRIHTGERPYTCSVCSKCFRHSGALTRHFRIHTGEKPYICGQCGKSFRNCGGLKFHQRSHSK